MQFEITINAIWSGFYHVHLMAIYTVGLPVRLTYWGADLRRRQEGGIAKMARFMIIFAILVSWRYNSTSG